MIKPSKTKNLLQKKILNLVIKTKKEIKEIL